MSLLLLLRELTFEFSLTLLLSSLLGLLLFDRLMLSLEPVLVLPLIALFTLVMLRGFFFLLLGIGPIQSAVVYIDSAQEQNFQDDNNLQIESIVSLIIFFF